MAETTKDFDVLIIGGGPAGLSAALCLGRARKRVVVLDAGSPRHAVADGVHNFLTREGMPPAELRRVAWEQMSAYSSVSRVTGRSIERLNWQDERWVAEDERGQSWRASAALLATGVIDEHPDIPGLRERWGHSIHQCPFCHGWEMQDEPLGVLAADHDPSHLALLLKGWSDDVVVLTHGRTPDDEQSRALREAGVEVYTRSVVSLSGEGRDLDTVHFDDGSTLHRRGLFVVAPQRQVPLVESLDLELDEMGYVSVDQQMSTSLPMLWAAGDVTSRLQQVIESAAQGNRAGALITARLTVG